MLAGCKREFRTDDGSVWLMEGDARTIVPQLEENSIDALVTDPPYGIVNQFGQNTGNGTRTMQFEWDSPAIESEVLAMLQWVTLHGPANCLTGTSGDGTFRFADGVKTYRPVMIPNGSGWRIVVVREA